MKQVPDENTNGSMLYDAENFEQKDLVILEDGCCVKKPVIREKIHDEEENIINDFRERTLSIISHAGVPTKPTSYIDTMMHMIKGNLGCGILAMGDAYKNGGLVCSTLFLFFFATICIYNQHRLVILSKKLMTDLKLTRAPGFAETIGLAFDSGSKNFRKLSRFVRRLVFLFIVVTQIGFCSVYFLFVSKSLQQISGSFGVEFEIHYLMVLVWPLITATAMIRNLKYIAPLSCFANVTTLFGMVIILYNSIWDLPPLHSRKLMGSWSEISLFIGTAVYTFEGISLVLPLEQHMKKRSQFLGLFGILNVSMVIVTMFVFSIGFFGYLKYGDAVKESLTLNLNDTYLQTRILIICMILSIMCSYALQFYVPVVLILPSIKNLWCPFSSHVVKEYLLRLFLVFLTFIAAEVIPHLDLFISLIGAIGGTFLALILPSLAYIISRDSDECGFFCWRLVVDMLSLLLGIVSFLSGSYFSTVGIINAFKRDFGFA